jgi:hypothetical protein
MPETSGRHPDSIDVRFERVFFEEFEALPDALPGVFEMPSHNGRADMRWSDVGALEDFQTFTGQVNYDQHYEGYDTTATFVEFAKGIQLERKLRDDDQFGNFDDRPRGLAQSAHRTRQVHGAQYYNRAFTSASSFYVNSESVALCSNSHTTRSTSSTASGFDNLGTSALSSAALETARQQMIGFRDDRANRISVVPNQISVGPANTEVAWEIVHSRGKLDTANNNANFNQNNYEIFTWNYITDTNDWFLEDTTMRRNHAFWVDRVPLEFAMVEDFDTFFSKWRGYMRYSWAWRNWRHIFGSQVS